MIYNPDYRRQIFWDTNDPVNFVNILRQISEMERYPRERYPTSRAGKTVKTGALICFILAVIAAVISFIISKSIILAIVVLMIGVGICLGVSSILLAFSRKIIIDGHITEKISATCIGYSLRGSGNSGRRVMGSPVFKYNYRGMDHIAFDAVWSTGSAGKPYLVGQECEIWIDPDDPDEMVWDKSNSNFFIPLVMGIFALALAGVFIFLAASDDAFKTAVEQEGDQTPVTEVYDPIARGEISDEYIDALFEENGLGNSDWTISERKLDRMEYNSQTGKYEFYFEHDDSFITDAISVTSDLVTENMKDAGSGDTYYWIEVEDGATIFARDDVEYTGDKLK